MQWHLQRNYYNHFFKKIIRKTNRHRRWNESVKQGTFLGGFLCCCSSYKIVFPFLRPFLDLMFLSCWLITYSMSKQWNASVFKETIKWWCSSLRDLVHICFSFALLRMYPFSGNMCHFLLLRSFLSFKVENSLSKTVVIAFLFDMFFISCHIVPCSPVESGPKYYLLLNPSKGTKWLSK